MQEFERVGSVDGHRTIEVFEGLRALFRKVQQLWRVEGSDCDMVGNAAADTPAAVVGVGRWRNFARGPRHFSAILRHSASAKWHRALLYSE